MWRKLVLPARLKLSLAYHDRFDYVIACHVSAWRRCGEPISGVVDTPMLDDRASTPEQAAAIRQGCAAYTPMLRPGHPEELAAATLFLASDESFMTGSDMVVDGGVSDV
jgi:NAD(P)-dependent dehydrogenase (short-subunit alcohol dehydrogenase family)